MESMVYKQGEAAGKLKGERKVLARLLNRRLGEAASPFVVRLQALDEDQLERVADSLGGTEPAGELKPLLERLFSGS